MRSAPSASALRHDPSRMIVFGGVAGARRRRGRTGIRGRARVSPSSPASSSSSSGTVRSRRPDGRRGRSTPSWTRAGRAEDETALRCVITLSKSALPPSIARAPQRLREFAAQSWAAPHSAAAGPRRRAASGRASRRGRPWRAPARSRALGQRRRRRRPRRRRGPAAAASAAPSRSSSSSAPSARTSRRVDLRLGERARPAARASARAGGTTFSRELEVEERASHFSYCVGAGST